eukprot:TRINITY_DN8892_c0_g1_i1.p1 TRINITY_DN8892_c0_g1~~TRINITY_DN8892_c0_g1_i1.p1  ORF type:complete len:638 (+),score=175.74 TRINITY_DN8892_c0_g1_i1:126-1916(+)
MMWSPNLKTAFYALLIARILSALNNIIGDCDETFNYWEPLHFLRYGYGLQTWEYSPEYSIRSYAYLAFHWIFAKFFSVFSPEKITVFYYVRFSLGILSALSEIVLYHGVRVTFGPRVAIWTFVFLFFSPGMFIASTALLPSSFSMYALAAAFGAWLLYKQAAAIVSSVVAVVLGWPFSGLVAVPIGLDFATSGKLVRAAVTAVLALVAVTVPCLLIDYYFYHKWTLPALNIVLYNVFGGSGGPNLYGEEPWTFYVWNALLNFNVAFVLAAVSAPIVVVQGIWCRQPFGRTLLYLSPAYLWFIFMSLQPHKEERFLFPIHPLLCFCAAVSLETFDDLANWLLHDHFDHSPASTPAAVPAKDGGPVASAPAPDVPLGLRHRPRRAATGQAAAGAGAQPTRKISPIFRALQWIVNAAAWLAVVVFIVMSVSRIASVVINFRAPLRVYDQLSERVLTPRPANTSVSVCVGKEWYRFPGNFFFPDRQVSVQFVRSSFNGQLPQPFGDVNATWRIPPNMNDANREEMSRYVELSSCDYFVDFEFPGQTEARLSEDPQWSVAFKEPFLDASSSPSLYRAFYVPFVTPKRVVYRDYTIFKRQKP